MIKVKISRYIGTPEIYQGKVRILNEKLDEVFEEEFDDSNVPDKSAFKKECVDRAVKRVLVFNTEEEQSALRDKKRPRKPIRKLIISSIN